MKKPKIKLEVRNSLLLLLTALIWGVAFVAQRQGGAEAGPYTFNLSVLFWAESCFCP